MKYQVGELSVGQILDNSFRLLKNRWQLFIGIGAILYAPILILQAVATLVFVNQPQGGMGSEEAMAAALEASGFILIIGVVFMVIYLVICGPLLGASITYAVSKEYLGQTTTIGESIKVALSKLGSVIWSGLLAGIIIFIGFLLLIIPGILLAFRYYLVQQVVVLEHESGSNALKRSAELMKGSYGIAFVLGFVIWIASMLIGVIGGMVPIPYASNLISIVLQTIAAVFWAVAAVVLYFHCRSKVEQYDLQLLAESVGADDPDTSAGPPPIPSAQ